MKIPIKIIWAILFFAFLGLVLLWMKRSNKEGVQNRRQNSNGQKKKSPRKTPNKSKSQQKKKSPPRETPNKTQQKKTPSPSRPTKTKSPTLKTIAKTSDSDN